MPLLFPHYSHPFSSLMHGCKRSCIRISFEGKASKFKADPWILFTSQCPRTVLMYHFRDLLTKQIFVKPVCKRCWQCLPKNVQKSLLVSGRSSIVLQGTQHDWETSSNRGFTMLPAVDVATQDNSIVMFEWARIYGPMRKHISFSKRWKLWWPTDWLLQLRNGAW